MKNTVRIASAVFKTALAQPMENADSIIEILETINEQKPDFVVFPELALTGASCQGYFKNAALLTNCINALDKIVTQSINYNTFIAVGAPMRVKGSLYSCTILIKGGKVVAVVPRAHGFDCFCSADDTLSEITISNAHVPFGTHLIFRYLNTRFAIETGAELQSLPAHLCALSANGVDFVLSPLAKTALFGDRDQTLAAMLYRSRLADVAVAYANPGLGESTALSVYTGCCGIMECGEILDFSWQEKPFDLVTIQDVDLDIIRSYPKDRACAASAKFTEIPLAFSPALKFDFLRNMIATRTPSPAYLADAFHLQKIALYGRLANTKIRKLVVGISGGLDSTLALLTACGAMDMLELPRKNIIAVTMPGFGTTDSTYFNALKLIELSCATALEIPIRDAVLQHFADIGHNPANQNTTYENAQARERTQILFDLANANGALVLGTGDLSEIALGWCTFGGDHLSSFNVNSCVTKTMMRAIVAQIAEDTQDEALSAVLRAVLETPVSPELLPPDENEIAQKTEELIGPYELHDFFLHYFVQYGFSGEKLYGYAMEAFGDRYSGEEVKRCLHLFLERFAKSQFKRGCAPEGPVLSKLSLNSANVTYPSDVTDNVLIPDFDKISVVKGEKI